jgi:glycosyltransferase involved in cell wall biosynthesis
MKVSVVIIGKTQKEITNLKEYLKHQTFKDFEIVTSTKKGIPQAWNDAIRKTKGEIIITTETDARPVNDHWIEDLVKGIEEFSPYKKIIIRGLEVNPTHWCMANIVARVSLFKENPFNERYRIAEDTEFFAHLRDKNYLGIELPIAPVIHERKTSAWKLIKKSFLYGFYQVRIQKKYGQSGFKTTFENRNPNILIVIGREISIILSRIAFLSGILMGWF